MMSDSTDTRDDPFQLARFVEAQRGTYDDALAEVSAGRKRSHWMWFIFPQLRGLGHSSMAQHYGLSGADEARAYLAHPVLGPRLVEICQALLAVNGRTAHDIFGTPDDLKLRSCVTLFAQVSPTGSVFHQLLEKYYAKAMDDRTLQLLERPTNL